MSKPVDHRIKVTKKILKEALIELMKDEPIRDITIKSICETAGVNRSTFYHHYGSQYELYDDIINDISEDIRNIISKEKLGGKNFVSLLHNILAYVESNRTLILVILGSNGNITIGEAFVKKINSFINPDDTSELRMYCSQFITAGMVNIIWTWLNTENRKPAREVAVVLNTLLMHGIKRAMTDGI